MKTLEKLKQGMKDAWAAFEVADAGAAWLLGMVLDDGIDWLDEL